MASAARVGASASEENPTSGASAMENSSEKQKQNPSQQVKEFRDTYGIFQPYLQPMEFEDNPNFNHMDYCDTDDEDTNHVPNPIKALIEHVKQVRDSFGFDVDVVVLSWAIVNYFPVNLSVPENRDDMMKGANVAIDGINADLGNKVYEVVEVVKAVVARNWTMHLTFTAKKVADAAAAEAGSSSLVTIQAMVLDGYQKDDLKIEQWRFKP